MILILRRKSKRKQLGHPTIFLQLIPLTHINELKKTISKSTSETKSILNKHPTMEEKANQALTYEEFDPFCKWHCKENEEVAEIHLPEFKKEQLKVQTSNTGILQISGERPLDASRKIKFCKQIQISSNYDSSAIRAKFGNGKLYITMAKGKTLVPQNPKTEPIKDQSTAPPPSDSAVKDQIQTPGGISTAMCEFQQRRRAAPSFRLAKVAVTLAVTAAAALIAYVVYVHMSTVDEVDDILIS